MVRHTTNGIMQAVIDAGNFLHKNPLGFVSLRRKRIKRMGKSVIKCRQRLDLLFVNCPLYECIC